VQAWSIFVLASKWEQKLGNASDLTTVTEWEFNTYGSSEVSDSNEFSIARALMSSSNRLTGLQCFTAVCISSYHFVADFELWESEIL
jgi:hypothetical protein